MYLLHYIYHHSIFIPILTSKFLGILLSNRFCSKTNAATAQVNSLCYVQPRGAF